MKSNKACTCLTHQKLYKLVWFLRSYKVLTSEFAICSNRRDVGMEYRTTDGSEANRKVKISKLLLYVSPINLVFIYHLEDNQFQSPDFWVCISNLQKPRWHFKMANNALFCLLKKLAKTLNIDGTALPSRLAWKNQLKWSATASKIDHYTINISSSYSIKKSSWQLVFEKIAACGR